MQIVNLHEMSKAYFLGKVRKKYHQFVLSAEFAKRLTGILALHILKFACVHLKVP